jgi:ferredoxin
VGINRNPESGNLLTVSVLLLDVGTIAGTARPVRKNECGHLRRLAMLADSDFAVPVPFFSINLQCMKCGKCIKSCAADLVHFLADEWPDCCGERLAFHAKLRWPENPPGGMALVGAL